MQQIPTTGAMIIMDAKTIRSDLNSIIGNYEKFAQIAMEIPWFSVEEQHEDWFKTYPLGIYMDLVHFPKGYVKAHFPEAYVRTALCTIAAAEEWDKDFFDISMEERKKCLCGERSEMLYGGYVNFSEVRLQICTEEHLRKEVNWFAGRNGISIEEQEKYLAYAKDATILELGGCYGGDYTYLVVKGDTLLLIDCGIWD